MIANIASDDALILPHHANPAGLNFRERQLDMLGKVMPPLPPESEQTPTTSQLVGINLGGIATLANSTYWRIAPGDLARARGWIPGAEITVAPTTLKKGVWPVTLTNEETGEHVVGVKSNAPPK